MFQSSGWNMQFFNILIRKTVLVSIAILRPENQHIPIRVNELS